MDAKEILKVTIKEDDEKYEATASFNGTPALIVMALQALMEGLCERDGGELIYTMAKKFADK